jgi:hypothetical protein
LSCDELLKRLTDYGEGALPSDLCREIQRHLDGCASCSDLRRDLLDLARLCRDTEAPRLPDEIRRRIEGLLQDR